jgi:hypothetical protein
MDPPEAPVRAMATDELLEISMPALSTLPEAQQETVLRLLRSERIRRRWKKDRRCARSTSLGRALAKPPQQARDLVRAFWAMQ